MEITREAYEQYKRNLKAAYPEPEIYPLSFEQWERMQKREEEWARQLREEA